MNERALALDEHELLVGISEHFALDGTGSVIDAHRVERYAGSGNRDADLPGGDKPGRDAATLCRLPRLEPRRHLPSGHVGPNEQNALVGKVSRESLARTETLGLDADVPDVGGTVGVAQPNLVVQSIDHEHGVGGRLIDDRPPILRDQSTERGDAQDQRIGTQRHGLSERSDDRRILIAVGRRDHVGDLLSSMGRVDDCDYGIGQIAQNPVAHLADVGAEGALHIEGDPMILREHAR